MEESLEKQGLLTISFQAIKAAIANPINSLRIE
jgi:hypothetical protein